MNPTTVMKNTFYLFDPATAHFNELLKTKYLEGEDRYMDVTKPIDDIDFEYRIYVERNKTKRPGWMRFLHGYVDDEVCNDMVNATNSFVILIKIPYKEGYRFFALPGGAGHNALNRDLVVDNFGLMTVLNAIDPEQIKHFDAKSIGARGQYKRLASSQSSSLANFDIDIDHDLIHAVSGKMVADLGEGNISGGGSLSLQGKTNFRQLGELAKSLIEHYESDRYRKHFGFIGNIAQERNKRTISILDELLVAAFRDRRSDGITITYPLSARKSSIVLYKITGNGPQTTTPDISLDSIYAYCDEGGEIDSDAIKQRIRIAGFASDSPDSQKTPNIPLYSFINFETEYRGSRYALSHRRWYRLNDLYLQTVDDQLTAGQSSDWSAPTLPYGQSIAEYLQTHFSGDADYLTLEHEALSLNDSPLTSQPIDLVHLPSRRLVFVTRSTDGATLDSMLDRASSASEALRSSSFFRKYLIDRFQKRWGQGDEATLQSPLITLAIAVEKNKSLQESLPPLAKINLARHLRNIQKRGLQVEIVAIQ